MDSDLKIDTLEPRIMLSASWSDGDVETDDTTEVQTSDPEVQDALAEELTLDETDNLFDDDDDPIESSALDETDEATGQHVVLIDANLSDVDQLEPSVENGMVILFDGEEGTIIDALQLVESAAEQGNFEIESLSILSHGDGGQIHLGTEAIDLDMSVDQQQAWSSLSDHLAPDGQVHFYACDVAGEDEGQQLLQLFGFYLP
ncbi:MAG: DUF4347 domain-containing protein [Planctomycetota bacterium]